jgi:CRP-like cAMP-binding protein
LEVVYVAKYRDGYYVQLSREIFDNPDLSEHAIYLYVMLVGLEHQFTGKDKDWFYRSDFDLAKDTRLSRSTLSRARKELINAGLIQVGKAKYKSPDGRKSNFSVNTYRIV